MAPPHARAIAHVTSLATGEPADPLLRLTLHFHPDRLVAGMSILELMARDGVYRSQYETGTSNGGLTAHPGGDRWRWESRHPEYRGPEFVDLGVSLARDGCLDPRVIGDASRTGRYDEQALKRVWHYVARFGSPEMRA
jgi:hypothetical protein